MRRIDVFLVAAGLPLTCARHHPFSIHEDMLAHPQFDIVISDSFVREADAESLLASNNKGTSATPSSDPAAATNARTSIRSSTVNAGSPGASAVQDEEDGAAVLSETYELINHPPFRFLCAIPVLAPSTAPNHTATELAKAEEAREAERAAARGWELMAGLNGKCLFYQSGWWSYTFCYNQDVVQFHALPPQGGAPVRDPSAPEYVLGRSLPQTAQQQNSRNGAGRRGGVAMDVDTREEQAVLKQDSTPHTPSGSTELIAKGDQRYLVQRLDSGTICDLTNRPRTIEIQYHCAPGTTVDRINWIKEVTTCAYLMMVQTPRLCEEGAFLPPKPVRSHPITCRHIITAEEEARGFLAGGDTPVPELTSEALGPPVGMRHPPASGDKPRHLRDFTGANIGGQIIGSRELLGRAEDGQPAPKLTPPPRRRAGRITGDPGGPQVQILAVGKSKAEGGRVEVVLDDDLESLGLDPAVVESLRNELQELAAEHGWKLELVDQPGRGVEIRAVVQDPERPQFYSYDGYSYDDEDGRYADDGQDNRRAGVKRDKSGNAAAAGRRAQDKKGKDKSKEKQPKDGEEAGSEEKFFNKDEL